jgi:hypothetical protein
MSKGIEKIIEKTAERDERGRVTRIIERHVTPPPEAIALSANTVADLIVLRALETLADPAVPIKVGQPIVLNMPIRGPLSLRTLWRRSNRRLRSDLATPPPTARSRLD